jgi:hypothetical protein
MDVQSEPPQINERLWQKWIWKNRELDKADARKRLRFFQILLVLTVGAVVVQNYMK